MNAFFETTFNFQIIDPLIESWGVRLAGLGCKISFMVKRKPQIDADILANDMVEVRPLP